MVQENKYWIYQRHYESDGYPITSGFLINFEGDTLINNTIYKKVWQQELSGTHPCPMGYMPCFVFDQPYHIFSKYMDGFIREDTVGRKVYYRSTSGLYCYAEEYLLFDFSLQVNDSLDECKMETLGGGVDHPEFGIIDSITYDSYWGLTRKVFHTTGWESLIGDFSSGQVNIIESVGFEHQGLFRDPANIFIGLYDFCEGSLSDCNIITKSMDLTVKDGISFYPNPAHNQIFVNDNLSFTSVKAMSLSGQETILNWQGNTIELSRLVSGFYILKIRTKERKLYMAKVIRE